jgi:hypothetical protein
MLSTSASTFRAPASASTTPSTVPRFGPHTS